VISLVGCLPRATTNAFGDRKWGVEVIYHGHSCVTLRDSTGRTIVIDPFDDSVGYGRLKLKADAVLVTDDHFDHDNIQPIRVRVKNCDLVRSTGTAPAAGMIVTGIDSDADDEGGAIHGPNRIYVFEMGGLRIAHLGILGQKKLTPAQLALLGAVDVIFIPVGGFVSLDGPGAKGIVDQLKPKVVFPTNYGPVRFYPLNPVEKFTEFFPADQVRRLDDSRVRIKADDLRETLIVTTLLPTDNN
jgi:L-ascorbate metabolism protein UlaG (beta-lactamase superfamily)